MHIHFDNITETVRQVLQTNKKIIYIAGASASGKSTFAEHLKQGLIKEKKSVLLLSSDSYYTNDSRLKYILYGSFDHPNLIDYPLLARDIKHYLKTTSINIPEYSFVESKKTGHHLFNTPVDYIIVEGLYTISQLPADIKPLKIFVDSHTEELIIRRLVRDQERVKEPVHLIVDVINRVFPMRNLYGKPQKKQADIIIDNGFSILNKIGITSNYTIIPTPSLKDAGTLINKNYLIDYEYDDSNTNEGVIVISEVYKSEKGLLDHVLVTKRKQHITTKTENFSSICYKITQPGMLTQLHTLMQIAGLRLRKIVKKIETTYELDGKRTTYKKRKGKWYKKG